MYAPTSSPILRRSEEHALKKAIHTLAWACLVVLAVTLVALPQRPAGSFPVIVVLKDNVSLESFRGQARSDERALAAPEQWDYLDSRVVGAVQAFERGLGFRAEHVFSHAIRGFSARLTTRQIQALENHSLVDYVEADGTMSIVAQTVPWGITHIGAAGKASISSVNVYVIDTGVEAHPDINRVGHVSFASGPNNDCNGHGTHVAGTIAAIDDTSFVVGVAPGAPVTGVKVLGCSGSGSTSGVIKGVDWVTANALKPAIANMSLGGGANTSLDNAVKNSVDKGIFYALAAGNEGVDACTRSPARAGTKDGVMTVAAISSTNQEPSWSNFGPCVDVWAPGVSVLSTYKGGGTKTLSGTSMASPHVGGTGARYLALYPSHSPDAVETALKSSMTTPGTKSKDGRLITVINASPY